MRIFRNITIVRLILELIFLGALVVLIIAALLFWDESSGIKTLAVLALAITFVILRIALQVYIIKREESLYRENTLNRLLFERKALEEHKRIKEPREELPGQIDAKINRVLNCSIIWMRMLRSEILIRLLLFAVSFFIFWSVFNFRWRLSLCLSIITGWVAGKIVHTIINHRIVILFEREFPIGSPERAIAIDYLSKNRHTCWFVSELLKIVGL